MNFLCFVIILYVLHFPMFLCFLGIYLLKDYIVFFTETIYCYVTVIYYYICRDHLLLYLSRSFTVNLYIHM